MILSDIPIVPSLDSYRPLSSKGEVWRAVLRVEPCECGGSVVQLVGDSELDAVMIHNASPSHTEWRKGELFR